MTKTLRANLLLLFTAMIWGGGFAAQDLAMDAMQPHTFNAVRLFLAGVALMLCIPLLDRFARKRNSKAEILTLKTMNAGQKRRLFTGGLVCGAVLGAGMAFQQYGILHSEAGKAGFITALYIVMVPLAGVFFRHRLRVTILFAVLLCTAGLFFLCVTQSLTIGLGDAYLLICAGCFTAHILAVAHYSPKTDGVRLSCIQFFVAAAMAAVMAVFFEAPALSGILAGWGPILYSAFISCGAGFTLQIIAQKDTAPAVASLLMSLESVFAVLAQWIILGDLLSGRELLGCGLMFAGIVLSQLPKRQQKRRPVKETAI